MMKLPEILYKISDVLESMNTKMILVGGSVRDHFLHKKIKDSGKFRAEGAEANRLNFYVLFLINFLLSNF